jgi:hypothetical protein
MPPIPGIPLAATINTSCNQRLQINNVPAGYTYLHTSLPGAESLTRDTSAQEPEHDTDFDADMLPDEGTSTGQYTICCLVMQLRFILMSKAAY